MDNFIRLEDAGILYKQYMYIDTPDEVIRKYLAIRGVSTTYVSSYSHDDINYHVMIIKVPKNSITLFEETMSNIENVMFLRGYNDYSTAWKDVMERLSSQ